MTQVNVILRNQRKSGKNYYLKNINNKKYKFFCINKIF